MKRACSGMGCDGLVCPTDPQIFLSFRFPPLSGRKQTDRQPAAETTKNQNKPTPLLQVEALNEDMLGRVMSVIEETEQ